MEIEKVVQAQLDAYNSKDIDLFCSFYHPDIIVKRLQSDVVLIQGRDKLQHYYHKLFQTHPFQHCQLKARTIVNGSVVDVEFITGRSSHLDGLHAVAIYGFKDGLIDRVWFV